MFTFFYLIAILLLNVLGDPSSVVHKANHDFGSHMTGFGMYVVFLVVFIIIDGLRSRSN
jgi:uncharacterized membrane protein